MELTVRRSLKVKQWVIGIGLPIAAIALLVTLSASGALVSWPVVALSVGSMAAINLLTLFFSKSWHKITNSIWKVTDEPTTSGWEISHEVEKLKQEILDPHSLLENISLEVRYDYHKKSFSYYPDFAVQVIGFHQDYLIQIPKTLKRALTDSEGKLDENALNACLLHALIRVSLQENVWQTWVRICTNTIQVCVDYLDPLIKQYPLIEFILSPILVIVNSITMHRDICYEADNLMIKLGHGQALRRFLMKASVPNHQRIAELCQKHPAKMSNEDLSPFSYPKTNWKYWVEKLQFWWHEWQQQAPTTYLRLKALEAAGVNVPTKETPEEQNCLICHPTATAALVAAFEKRYTARQTSPHEIQTQYVHAENHYRAANAY